MQKKKHTPFTFCVKLEQIDKPQLQKKKKILILSKKQYQEYKMLIYLYLVTDMYYKLTKTISKAVFTCLQSY